MGAQSDFTDSEIEVKAVDPMDERRVPPPFGAAMESNESAPTLPPAAGPAVAPPPFPGHGSGLPPPAPTPQSPQVGDRPRARRLSMKGIAQQMKDQKKKLGAPRAVKAKDRREAVPPLIANMRDRYSAMHGDDDEDEDLHRTWSDDD